MGSSLSWEGFISSNMAPKRQVAAIESCRKKKIPPFTHFPLATSMEIKGMMHESSMFISAPFITVLYNDSAAAQSDNKNSYSQPTINTQKQPAHLKVRFLFQNIIQQQPILTRIRLVDPNIALPMPALTLFANGQSWSSWNERSSWLDE